MAYIKGSQCRQYHKLDFHILILETSKYSQYWVPAWLREALKKKYGIIWEFFPTWGGGVFPIPKSQNQKKVPFNHPKIT